MMASHTASVMSPQCASSAAWVWIPKQSTVASWLPCSPSAHLRSNKHVSQLHGILSLLPLPAQLVSLVRERKVGIVGAHTRRARRKQITRALIANLRRSRRIGEGVVGAGGEGVGDGVGAGVVGAGVVGDADGVAVHVTGALHAPAALRHVGHSAPSVQSGLGEREQLLTFPTIEQMPAAAPVSWLLDKPLRRAGASASTERVGGGRRTRRGR